MLDTTLVYLRDQLSGYLDSQYPNSKGHVTLSGLSNLDGTVPPSIEDKIVLSLVNIERETAAASAGTQLRPDGGGGFLRMSAPLNLNLYVLVSASFGDNYQDALKILSATLGYFQGTPLFTANTQVWTPNAQAFPIGLDKLTIEMVNLDIQGLNNLWGTLGGKYLPSVLYKARMFTLQAGWVQEQVPPISRAGAGT